jgi:hypothetical protein
LDSFSKATKRCFHGIFALPRLPFGKTTSIIYIEDIMKAIFEIATRISTPLMLGGVCVFVLFFILSKILSGLSLKEVQPRNTTKILLSIIRAVWILALVGVVIGGVGYYHKLDLQHKYPSLYPKYVDVNTDRSYSLERIVKMVDSDENVNIYFDDACGQSVRQAMIAPGDHDGKDIQDFLQKLKDRVEGKSINFQVKKEGEARYEITCP